VAAVIIVHGPPNSGKSTQAKKLAQKHGYAHLSSGEELRNTQDPEIMERMQKGMLSKSEDVMRLMKAAVSRVPAKTVIVFDGTPRMINELHDYEEWFKEIGRSVDKVIEINISPAESHKRSQLRQRHEDMNTEERWKWYRQETQKVIDAAKERGILIAVDGEGSVDAVAARLEDAL
jgi:adenylate kinase